MHLPWIDEMIGLSLQVWSMPTVHVEAGPTQPAPGRKQPPFGQVQTSTVTLFDGEQPQAPTAVVQVPGWGAVTPGAAPAA